MAIGSKIGWIVSYPKSGNTWLRLMLWSLMQGGAPVDINRASSDIGIASHIELDELLIVESGELFPEEQVAVLPALYAAIASDTAASGAGGLVLRKLHDRYWHMPSGAAVFPAEISRAAVYVVRDPRDIAVSYAHHRGWPVDRIIAMMADPDATLSVGDAGPRRQLAQPLGHWSGHVSSWLEQTDIPVLLLRYEDMLAAPASCLRAAAEHFELPASTEAVAKAVAATGFEQLRAQEQRRGFRERQSGASAPFFRQGQAGGWRQTLTQDQAARIRTAHHAVMQRLGYN